jgi:hypothetical protein
MVLQVLCNALQNGAVNTGEVLSKRKLGALALVSGEHLFRISGRAPQNSLIYSSAL